VAVPAPTQGFPSPSLIATQTPKAIASANTVMVLVATATLTRISRSHLGSSSLRRTVELICKPVVCADGSWLVADMLSNSHRTMLGAVAAPAAAHRTGDGSAEDASHGGSADALPSRRASGVSRAKRDHHDDSNLFHEPP
jgi:hypothetical protein